MKGRWRVTPLGWVVIGALAACALVVTVTHGTAQFVAGAVAGGILLMLVSEGLSGPGDTVGSAGRKRETLERERVGEVDDR